MDDFLVRASLAGLAVALAAGPLGSLVVWRRMAFFGDAMSHAAVLGVAIALMFSAPVGVGTFALALGFGLLISALNRAEPSGDTTLAVLAHASLAIGLVLVSFVDGVRVNIEALLFGDILTTTTRELILLWIGTAIILGVILARWSRLLTVTLNAELAVSSGINPKKEDLIFTLTLALMVAMAIKIVGALLITAMLVIPAAAARRVTRSPEAMALVASLMGGIAVATGLSASLLYDTPTGPSVVASAAGLYGLAMVFGGFKSAR